MLRIIQMETYIAWGYLGLFFASFLAATVLPFSSEIVLSSLLANQYSLGWSLMIATLGNWLGGMSSYFLGRLGKWNVLERYFGVSISRVETVKKQIERWGSFLAFFCWLPIVGDVLAIGLGFFKIEALKVGFWMLVGKAIRYAIWAVLSYWGISLLQITA